MRFGVLLFAWPAGGALTLVRLIGVAAIVFGVTLMVAAFQLRRLGHGDHHQVGDAGDPAGPRPV